MSRKESGLPIEEASAWLALLHGPRRREDIASGFRRWMAESAAHKRAFEAVTAMWEADERLPKRPLPLPQRWRRAGFRVGFRWAVGAVAAAVVLMAIAGILYVRHAGVVTGIGEQRMLTLADGSRVYLNTDTRVRVDFTNERRGVELERGEALFEVAKAAPNRPFVVSAGGKEITALGTAFVVRRDADALSVTLVEGRVAILPSSPPPLAGEGRVGAFLTPGERIIFAATRPPKLDRPNVEKTTAWRRGRVELHDTPLAEAAAELNRYSTMRLAIESPDAARIPVTGAFRAGDSGSFAQSVASSCGLTVVQKENEILLAGVPTPNCR